MNWFKNLFRSKATIEAEKELKRKSHEAEAAALEEDLEKLFNLDNDHKFNKIAKASKPVQRKKTEDTGYSERQTVYNNYDPTPVIVASSYSSSSSYNSSSSCSDSSSSSSSCD